MKPRLDSQRLECPPQPLTTCSSSTQGRESGSKKSVAQTCEACSAEGDANHVVLLRSYPPIRTVNEEASTESNMGLLLRLSSHHLPPTRHLHSCLLRPGLVGNISRPRTEDKECRDSLRDRRSRNLPTLVHEHCTGHSRFHASLDARRFNLQSCQYCRKRDSKPHHRVQ